MSADIVAYFATIPSSHRALILAGGIGGFWILESAVPLFRFQYQKRHHAALNIFFTLTTVAVNFGMAFLLLGAADWAVAHQFGLLQWAPAMPFWLFTLLGLLGLDLSSAWLAHWVQHRMPVLWRFHLIHHTDATVDTTSANRHHPGESVVRFAFTALAALVLGTPIWLVFLYQALSVVLSQFNHANIVLPRALDRALSWVIVSPDMHKVHHHYVLPYTDSNYGNIFSVWDRLFGTFRILERDRLVYGVDTHMAPADHSHLGNLLMIPFQPRRNRRSPP
ncbi:MAG: sterol desaturase family protein [Gemmatimonadota bacterium]|nr:sterol desaturase family protein [Gemmatimonadota bacterium]